MKLIIEPVDGVAPLLAAIKRAKKSVEIAIFRFDRKDVEVALQAAAAKGVRVTALIAFANRGGEKNLRQLELRLLDAGIIVARTAGDLIRYHGKYILIDRRMLYCAVVQLHAARHRPQPRIRLGHEAGWSTSRRPPSSSRRTARGSGRAES